jgi:hypothetical protein
MERTEAKASPRDARPSEVRIEVLTQHTALRRRLASVRNAAHRVLEPPEVRDEQHRALRSEVLRLCDELELHLAYEENALVPLLEPLDSWGPVRAARLKAEHERQRGELRAFADACAGEGYFARRFAEQVRSFVVDMLEDMGIEEALLLHPDVLRDDIISVEQTDG